MTIPPIKFIKGLKTDTWKLAEIKTLVDDKECKVCNVPLKAIVSLVGANRIDVGVCPDCGLCTYMQKPPKESLDNTTTKYGWATEKRKPSQKPRKEKRQ